MNLTLSADDEVVRRARLAASRQGRSLNDLMREHLERLAGMNAGAEIASEFEQLIVIGNGRSGERFQRGDAYDRRRS
ncbi:MAG: MerR family transcriptional regulator [Deltaproteobacteria bacterium]|nr:MerR family transcriptional regulator [Deltaproteobacteria bacterium]